MYKSEMERNKNFLGVLRKTMLNELNNEFCKYGDGIYWLNLEYLGFDFKALFSVRLDLEIYEEENFVVIGIPLRVFKTEVYISSESDSWIMSSIEDFFYRYNPDKLSESEINDYTHNIPHFKNSKYYKLLEEAVTKANEESKVKFSLAGSEYPKFKRRDILPVALFDFTKGEVSYNDMRSTSSFRKHRKSMGLKNIDLNRLVDESTDKMNLPMRFIVWEGLRFGERDCDGRIYT